MLKTILLVDDYKGVYESLSLIKDEQHRILWIDNLKDAIKIFFTKEKIYIDLVILDLDFKGTWQCGFDLIPYIKKKDINIPIIVLSGTGSERTAQMALDLGCQKYIIKPFDESFIDTINKCLGIKSGAHNNILPFNVEKARNIVNYIKEEHDKYINASYIYESVKESSYSVKKLLSYQIMETEKAYLNCFRIAQAKELLIYGKAKVKEIPALVGFRSKNTFHKLFFKHVKMTPAKFKKYRSKNRIAF